MPEFGHETPEAMIIAPSVVGIPITAIVVWAQVTSTKRILNAMNRK